MSVTLLLLTLCLSLMPPVVTTLGALNFVGDIVIGPDETQVAVIHFADKASVIYIWFDCYETTLLISIDGFTFTRVSTNTDT